MTQMNNDQIFDQVKTLLVELFELDANDIHLDSHLYQDLDLDSIDAVDLVVRLQNLTGKKIQADEFKTVRTVNDVVIAVADLLKAQ
ncbi:acyl carrier protein [Photobacterium aquimaris]|uniref:Acyl carrier protein n=1 Tax=Photobacterium aquimaris TaxID=512643 RepID=A0A2T3IPI6_9GAMM|nr:MULTISPECIES: acyl carrier protein [Photobacterium]OBU16989.1 acyl carrier protein [Photobacterium aquimaris]OBU21908.1 acyl carrier protein [Photobacterium aquimaris]PSU30267.1 acyl carrier protein [Photobacterium aquimaris]PSV99397.1 acyl carrier protein [Photobacterium aquimaris]